MLFQLSCIFVYSLCCSIILIFCFAICFFVISVFVFSVGFVFILRGRHSRFMSSLLNYVFDFVKYFQSNLVICSLNVRGLSNEIKRRETFNWLRNKKCTVQKKSKNYGWLNGGIEVSSAASQALEPVFPSYLTTIFLLRFKNISQIHREDLSQLISKPQTKL